jgi:hypothetical protein
VSAEIVFEKAGKKTAASAATPSPNFFVFDFNIKLFLKINIV